MEKAVRRRRDITGLVPLSVKRDSPIRSRVPMVKL
jgi:hypothetical protein